MTENTRAANAARGRARQTQGAAIHDRAVEIQRQHDAAQRTPHPYTVTETASSRDGFSQTFATLPAAVAYIDARAADFAITFGMTVDDAIATYFTLKIRYPEVVA